MVAPVWMQAYLWGVLAGSGLIIGALIAFFTSLPHRVIAVVMGFGSGVLISTLSFSLIEEAYSHGGFFPTVIGFISGGLLFSTANWALSIRGARDRKRCGECNRQPTETDHSGSGLAIAVGALMDGIPESLVIGISLVGGMAIDTAILIGFFLANIPEGLSSVSGMRHAGRSALYIFGVWGSIAFLSGSASLLGYAVFGSLPVHVTALTTALAAGGVLAMTAETMIPEAFENAQHFIGVITVIGFLTFFIITKI